MSSYANVNGTGINNNNGTDYFVEGDGDLDASLADTGTYAVIALFGWLVPHVFIAIAEARWEIARSSMWKGDKLEAGLVAVTTHSAIAIAVSMVVVAATAAGVAASTVDLQVNMLYVLSGLSRFASAVIVFLISIRIKRWFGIYHSEKDYLEEHVGYTLNVLKFNIRWRIFKIFFQVYFVMLPFYCGPVGPAVIPVAMILGMVFGALICLAVYFGRTRCKTYKRSISIAVAVILIVLSAWAFAGGALYIQAVWFPDTAIYRENVLWISCFFAWIVAGILLHLIVWTYSKRKAEQRELLQKSGGKVRSQRFQTKLFHPKHFTGISNADDILPPNRDEEDDGANPECAAENADNDNDDDNERTARKVRIKSITTGSTKFDDDGDDNEKDTDDGEIEIDDTKGPNDRGDSVVVDGDDAEEKEMDEGKDSANSAELEDPTWASLIRGKLCCCCGWCGPRCVGYTVKPISDDDFEEEDATVIDRIVQIFSWTIWILASIICLYITIVNIGATVQADKTMQQLPYTDEVLYDHINDGPVCAFDEVGAQPYDIKTFPSAADAVAANWTVAHCGACGACSPWSILSIQWTTRDELAKLSKRCATMTLQPNGFEKALQCHIDTIGFDYECSKCWVNDEICARDNCVFIYLQSQIINTVGNFKVAPGTITSATCEEAMCELVFVPCVGATRRRMNIISSIARPKDQQCTNVDPSQWERLWGPSG